MSKREPIASVIDKPSTPPALRAQLESVTAIRDFASRELGAAGQRQLSQATRMSAGLCRMECGRGAGVLRRRQEMVLPHRRLRRLPRLFRRGQGAALCGRPARQGFDVVVGGVAAYSTLGHFDDPILNTMVGWDDVELAAIIFHELTHQLLYVRNDASFNEALATTVEEEGVRRWLRASRPRAGSGGTSAAARALSAGDRAADRDTRASCAPSMPPVCRRR